MEPFGRLLLGDCKDELAGVPDGTVDLLATSPPYADRRSKTYGGIHPDQYVEWFLERASEFKRVLHPEGTFILNIKEHVVDGERHTYVLDLVKALKGQGWLWTEDYVWRKRNSYPGKWPNRFRDGWEHLHQFNKQRRFSMYQDAVRVPIGPWVKTRLAELSDTDRRRDASRVESGFGKRVANWMGRDKVYPDNVLELATECGNKGHSAAFPEALPAWFIRLFTKPGDLVLDPFCGSGTTPVAALRLGRYYLGIDNVAANLRVAEERLAGVPIGGGRRTKRSA